MIDFEWDKLLILKTYEEQFVESCYKNISLSSSKITVTEGSDEYLFIKNNSVVKHVINPMEGWAISLITDSSILKNKNYRCGISKSNHLFIKNLPSDGTTANKFLLFEK